MACFRFEENVYLYVCLLVCLYVWARGRPYVFLIHRARAAAAAADFVGTYTGRGAYVSVSVVVYVNATSHALEYATPNRALFVRSGAQLWPPLRWIAPDVFQVRVRSA